MAVATTKAMSQPATDDQCPARLGPDTRPATLARRFRARWRAPDLPPYPEFQGQKSQREETRAHDLPARPQGTGVEGRKNQDAGPQRLPATAGRMHARLHHDAEEAQLRAAQ